MSDPEGFETELARAQLLFDAGRYQDCETYARRALELNPLGHEAHFLLSQAYTRLSGRMRDAQTAIDLALSGSPNVSAYHAYRAYILSCRHQKRRALRAAHTAVSLDPESSFAYIVRASIHGAGHPEKAEADAHFALKLDPSSISARLLLSQALRLQKRLKESEVIAKQVLSETPRDAFALANAGWLAIEAGNLSLAVTYVEQALACDPLSEFARNTWFELRRRRIFLYRWEARWREGVLDFLSRDWTEGRLKYLVFIPHAGILLFCCWAQLLFTGIFLWLLARSFADYFICLDSTSRHALTRKEWHLSLFKGLVVIPVLLYLILTQEWVGGQLVWLLFALTAFGMYQLVCMCARLTQSHRQTEPEGGL